MEPGSCPGSTVSEGSDELLSEAPESDVPLGTWAQDEVFRHSDILEVISYHIGDPLASPSAFSARQDLFCAALTCRGFLAPCMDILWRDLDSLLPVLRLLPDFTYVDGSYILLGTVQVDDWLRLDTYARRVRSLAMGYDSSFISPQVFIRLLKLRSNPLLPALAQLRISTSSFTDAQSSFLLPAPALTSVEIDIGTESAGVPTLLLTLSQEQPLISHLSLRGAGKLPSSMFAPSCAFISHMKHISSLHLSFSVPSIFNSLMPVLEMVSLIDLSLDLRGCTIECVMPYFVFPPLPGAIAPVRRIKKLRVEGEGPIILHLTKRLGVIPSLTVLEVIVHSDRTVLFPLKIGTFFHNIMLWILLLAKSIRSLRIHNDSAIHASESSAVFLNPNLIDLEHLEFTNFPISAEDEDIEAFTLSSPSLIDLFLPGGGQKLPSPAVLRYLSENCPKLEHLQIHLNMTFVPKLPESYCYSHLLKNLTIGSYDFEATIDNLIAISSYLHRLFPHLRTVQQDDAYDIEQWGHVDLLLRAFQSVRKDTYACLGLT